MELSCIENRPSVRLLNSKYLRTGFLLQAHTKWIWFSILAVEPFSREHVEGMTNKIKMETRSLHNFFPLAIHKGNSNPYLCNYYRDLESKISTKGREQNWVLQLCLCTTLYKANKTGQIDMKGGAM